jgi:hypothetical protein
MGDDEVGHDRGHTDSDDHPRSDHCDCAEHTLHSCSVVEIPGDQGIYPLRGFTGRQPAFGGYAEIVGGRLRGPGLVGPEILSARKERVAAYLIRVGHGERAEPGRILGSTYPGYTRRTRPLIQ